MFSKKSIRDKFILQLVVASAALIVIFSITLYNYIKISIYEDITSELIKEANFFSKSVSSVSQREGMHFFRPKNRTSSTKASVVIRINNNHKTTYEKYTIDDKHYIRVLYPHKSSESSFIQITKDISNTDKLLNKIIKNIFIINIIMLFFILFYALFLSQMLIYPIKSLANKLAKLNENFLIHINTNDLPLEFTPLGGAINKLINRIQTFVKYQKELFIGTAHELKTPLAVMKTKNEVTLIKPRERKDYIEAIKISNKTIDEMNKMIGNILEIGRQEGAQFELPEKLDLIKFLEEKSSNFKLLCEQENKNIITDLKPDTFTVLIQPTLLLHIVQNFVQNAVKFTPKKGTILIKSENTQNGFLVQIIDEGEGIDESKDLFAPFKRFGDKSGAGLGLFLAKGAADAIGAKISIKNRKDHPGAIASILIPSLEQTSSQK